MNNAEDPGVADDNGAAGHHKCHQEEDCLWGMTARVLDDCTTPDPSVQLESSPSPKQRRNNGGKGPHPNQGNHQTNVVAVVHPESTQSQSQLFEFNRLLLPVKKNFKWSGARACPVHNFGLLRMK